MRGQGGQRGHRLVVGTVLVVAVLGAEARAEGGEGGQPDGELEGARDRRRARVERPKRHGRAAADPQRQDLTVLVLPVVAFSLLRHARRWLGVGEVLRLVGLGAAPLCLYAYLPIVASSDPLVNSQTRGSSPAVTVSSKRSQSQRIAAEKAMWSA